MRVKRVEKFRKYRKIKARKNFFLFLLLPISLVFLGYLISSLVILPAMK
ncbi:MAG: hypothetical protein K0R31_1389 [Clostridiales bacterium]|jgi:hypothetical protein|nr:hypothetical protein [Clostridiales bacterium]